MIKTSGAPVDCVASIASVKPRKHLHRAVDDAENLLEEVNYEALRLKVEGQHQNLVETRNQQVSDLKLSLSDDFFLNPKEKLEDTIETLEDLQNQIISLA